MGDEKLTYLGYSYHTLLGSTYAQLFGRNVRAMVLDGAMNPKLGFVATAESRARGFERAFTRFSAWCAKKPVVCTIAPDARKVMTTLITKAGTSPAKGSTGRLATKGVISVALASALLDEWKWPDIANAIADLRTGDPADIFALADSSYGLSATSKQSTRTSSV